MKKDNNPKTGCNACRQAVYSTSELGLELVAVHSDGPTFLRRCLLCQTFWDFRLRVAVPISEAEARDLYPQAFQTIEGS